MSQRFQSRRELTGQDLGKGLRGGPAAYGQSKAAGGRGSGARGPPRASSEGALLIQVFGLDPEGSRDHRSVIGRGENSMVPGMSGAAALNSGVLVCQGSTTAAEASRAGRQAREGPLSDVFHWGVARQHGMRTRCAGASR